MIFIKFVSSFNFVTKVGIILFSNEKSNFKNQNFRNECGVRGIIKEV
jgi:hypothetical protein